MFRFTPLLGARVATLATQSLLEFEGGIKILIDVGWDNDFDPAQLQPLEQHLSSLSLILLTHATRSHLAAFAHCCKHFPLFSQIPIYATTPVISLGRTLLQDLYASTPLAASTIPSPAADADNAPILLAPPTPDEIMSYFALINPLKYSQPHQPNPPPFSPPLNGLTITAYNAGHSLGGTIWHLQHGLESVVYAVDWNQVREHVFDSAAWLSRGSGAEVIEQLRQPTALICSCKGATRTAVGGGRDKRDELLLDMVRSGLSRGGIVMIPTDSSARMLELAYVMEHAWRTESAAGSDSPLKSASLFLASHTVEPAMRYARSMMEWMDDSIVREFENEATDGGRQPLPGRGDARRPADDSKSHHSSDRLGPLDFRFLHFFQRKSQIERALARGGPQVILASDESLDWGFSRDVLASIAEQPNNLIILTGQSFDQGQGKGLGSALWQLFNKREDGVAVEQGRTQTLEQVYTGGRPISIDVAEQLPLDDSERARYEQYLATRRQIQPQTGANGFEGTADALEDDASDSSSSDEDSDSEQQGKSLNFTASGPPNTRTRNAADREVSGVMTLLRSPGCYDWDVRGKRGREAIFPTASRRRKMDDYGEVIRPEDYLRAEERDSMDAQGDSSIHTNALPFGQKRRWGDVQDSLQDSRGLPQRTRTGDQGLGNHDNIRGDEGEQSEDEQEPLIEGPSKVQIVRRTVNAQLRIAQVDFAGLHDQRSLSMIIPLIAPRKLILTGGTAAETDWLAEECRQKLRPQGESRADVYTPNIGELVTASMDTHAWTVKLSDALVRKLQWRQVRGLSVVTLRGRLTATASDSPSEEHKLKRLKTEPTDETKTQTTAAKRSDETPAPPTLDVVPEDSTMGSHSLAQPLHVGDLRLADLRRVLQTAGHSADFRGEGTLVIDGLVAVRKSVGGTVEVEGVGRPGVEMAARTRDDAAFYSVKRRIYEGLAVVAGG